MRYSSMKDRLKTMWLEFVEIATPSVVKRGNRVIERADRAIAHTQALHAAFTGTRRPREATNGHSR